MTRCMRSEMRVSAARFARSLPPFPRVQLGARECLVNLLRYRPPPQRVIRREGRGASHRVASTTTFFCLALREAPVKKVARMLTKIAGDLAEEYERAAAAGVAADDSKVSAKAPSIKQQGMAAGYMEGHLTAQRMADNIDNLWPSYFPETSDFS